MAASDQRQRYLKTLLASVQYEQQQGHPDFKVHGLHGSVLADARVLSASLHRLSPIPTACACSVAL
jgi:hypothetical protein